MGSVARVRALEIGSVVEEFKTTLWRVRGLTRDYALLAQIDISGREIPCDPREVKLGADGEIAEPGFSVLPFDVAQG